MRKTLASATLFVTALSLGASWSHILQIRGKASWEAPFWHAAMETLYRDYATLGAATELGAILLAWLLTFSFRRHRAALRWAALGSLLLTIAFFGLWIGFIAPVNAVFATSTPETMPRDWTFYRDRWEFWHATIAVAKAAAFVALTTAILSWNDVKRIASEQ